MQNMDFGGHDRVAVRAKYIGERIDLRALETTQRIAPSPLVVAAGSHGCAVLFRYGVVVLFNLPPVEEVAFLEGIRRYIGGEFTTSESEDVFLILDDSESELVDSSGVHVKSYSLERVQLLADVLAKSTVLAFYERNTATIFDQVEPLAVDLMQGGRSRFSNRELLRQMGSILLTHHKMVGRVEVRDKPEVLWDHRDLERLYARLIDEYEINERHAALDRKLQLIAQTAETLVELMRHRSTLRVEWYIVILIVVEIVLMLFYGLH